MTVDEVVQTLHLSKKTSRLAKRLKNFHARKKKNAHPLCYVLYAAKLTDASVRFNEAIKRFTIKSDFEKDYANFEMDISNLMKFKFAFDGTNSLLGDPFLLLKDVTSDLSLDFDACFVFLEKLYIHEKYINIPMMGLVAIACYSESIGKELSLMLKIDLEWIKKQREMAANI
eukprot:NODE_305_length_10201_cov_0.856464.p7 type:complete len:172 gc:universal NODE_305_length_10201_cov_0.856464:7961-8476(+)